MSPEAWSFFSANTLALIGIISEQLKARRKARVTVTDVQRASVHAKQAAANTRNISNGFAKGVRDDLSNLTRLVINLDERMTRVEEKVEGKRPVWAQFLQKL